MRFFVGLDASWDVTTGVHSVRFHFDESFCGSTFGQGEDQGQMDHCKFSHCVLALAEALLHSESNRQSVPVFPTSPTG